VPRTLVILAVLTAFAPSAHAADSTVVSSYSYFPVPGEGNDHLVVVECDAEAKPGSARDVPVATSIACTVAGIEQHAVSPGPVAATAFPVVVPSTFQLCTSAEATFFDSTTNRVHPVVDTRFCTDVHL
jgi:hypothetical protein